MNVIIATAVLEDESSLVRHTCQHCLGNLIFVGESAQHSLDDITLNGRMIISVELDSLTGKLHISRIMVLPDFLFPVLIRLYGSEVNP
ncbi:hypothetical protein D3C73_1112260 [compost metagenome]